MAALTRDDRGVFGLLWRTPREMGSSMKARKFAVAAYKEMGGKPTDEMRAALAALRKSEGNCP